MSIVPNFTTSALSTEAENRVPKRKFGELEQKLGGQTSETPESRDNDENSDNNDQKEESDKQRFHNLIRDKLQLNTRLFSDQNKAKKQKKLGALNTNMTVLEQMYFPELITETTNKSQRVFYRTLYNIQSPNTVAKQRKTYAKRVHSWVSKNPQTMLSIVEKLIPIVLEKDFSNSRFHCFKLLSQSLPLLTTDFFLSNGQFLENLWLFLIYLILDPTLSDNSPKDDESDDVSDVLNVESKRLITDLFQLLGFKNVISLLKPHLSDEAMMDPLAVSLSLCEFSDPAVLQFVHLLCNSDSWIHRFVGCKAIYFSIQNGSSSSGTHLRELLECIKPILSDKVYGNKIIAALTLNLLVPKPDGGNKSFAVFESTVLNDLLSEIGKSRGKLLAFQLRALASLVPLMDLELTTIYGKQVVDFATREMNSTNSNMHLTILISIQKLLEAKTFMDLASFKEKLFDPFFTNFWTRQTSLLGGKLSTTVLFTTSMIAKKAGIIYVIERLLEHLKDKLESLRVMSVQVISRVLNDSELETVTFPQSLEERLVDSLLIAFQEQKTETNAFVNCFISLAEKMGKRLEVYLLPIISTGLNLMSNQNQILRRNAAELCASLTHICADLGETELVIKLGAVFYENLGEPIGDVLQHVVRCLAEVFRCSKDINRLQPPVTQLLPTLTPILKNPHYGVSKNLLDLVGQISKRCSDMIPPREWNRVCNEILEMFKSPIKDIRIQANDTFGVIAEGIGPQEIIITLLNNLKMSERQIRLCSSIAMAIVAKVCGTFTILPALMNEFRTPDTNIKNGILKALAFIFEYIDDDSVNYVYHMVPMLEHALTDRNIVLRQTASTVVKTLSVACKSCDREDAFIHLLNLLIPNIFETSPHAIERIRAAITSIRVTIGTDVLMQYVWAGLTHPSGTVREAYFAVFNIIKEEECERLVPLYPLNAVSELDNVL